MPARNQTKRPQHVIDTAVKRYMAGEQATALAKEYKISKPGIYLWIAKYKKHMLENAKTANMTPADAAIADKRTLLLEREALRQENRKLRERLLNMMLKSGDL